MPKLIELANGTGAEAKTLYARTEHTASWVSLHTGTEDLMAEAKKHQAPFALIEYVAEHGKLPVPNFSAGGIATPADASLVMQLGAEAVFVGSGIFKSADPEARAKAIVKAATYFNDPAKLLEASEDLGMGMPGLDISKLQESELMQTRGW